MNLLSIISIGNVIRRTNNGLALETSKSIHTDIAGTRTSSLSTLINIFASDSVSLYFVSRGTSTSEGSRSIDAVAHTELASRSSPIGTLIDVFASHFIASKLISTVTDTLVTSGSINTLLLAFCHSRRTFVDI